MATTPETGDNNMTTTTALTNAQQRGTLCYMKSDYTYKTVEGWFFINDNYTVVMRKIGGRNRFSICTTYQVYDFVPTEAKK
jgi:hypothetical protein